MYTHTIELSDRVNQMTGDQLEAGLLADPSTSYWLRDRLAATSKRDPVKLLKDAELLVVIIRKKLDRDHRTYR